MSEESTTPVISWDVNKAAIAEVAEELKDVDAYKDLPAAKAAKKQLTKMRTTLADAHKETKAEALAFGKLCDTKKNEYLGLIKEIEDPISKQLDEIKNAAALAEELRIGKINAELDRLRAYADDRHSLTLDELTERLTNLRDQKIDEFDFAEFEEDATLACEEADMKLRITLQNEKERIEEEAKQAEIAAENARVAANLAERQAKMDAEDAARQAVRDQEDTERRERDEAEAAKRRAEQDKIAAEQAEAQKLIDAENDRIAQEATNKEREEREAAEAAEAAERAAEQAPDRQKLLSFAIDIDDAIKGKPNLTTEPANEILRQATAMLIEVAYDIRTSTEEMK